MWRYGTTPRTISTTSRSCCPPDSGGQFAIVISDIPALQSIHHRHISHREVDGASLQHTLADTSSRSRIPNQEVVPVKDLIELIAKALVDNPEEVAVRLIEGEQSTVLQLKVAQHELGKIIGNHGRTFQSLQKILTAAGMKSKKRFVLELLGPENWN